MSTSHDLWFGYRLGATNVNVFTANIGFLLAIILSVTVVLTDEPAG